MRPLALLHALFALGLAGTPTSAAAVRRSHAIQATVKNGTYSGLALPTFGDQEAFFGVPYARPPVGDLRLRQAAGLDSSWSGVKPLTERVAQVCHVPLAGSAWPVRSLAPDIVAR